MMEWEVHSLLSCVHSHHLDILRPGRDAEQVTAGTLPCTMLPGLARAALWSFYCMQASDALWILQSCLS